VGTDGASYVEMLAGHDLRVGMEAPGLQEDRPTHLAASEERTHHDREPTHPSHPGL
jgi:hypothetical protein